jgi:hypothetical protein
MLEAGETVYNPNGGEIEVRRLDSKCYRFLITHCSKNELPKTLDFEIDVPKDQI